MSKTGLSLAGQIDHCFSALDAFKRCLRSQQWHRLSERNLEVNQQMQGLASSLAEQNVDEEGRHRIRLLEVEVRRLQRQLALQMKAVKEDIGTVDSGLQKLERAANTIKEE